MSIIVKDLEEKIGTDKVEEILDKEWKVAEPPSEEQLAKEELKHPKARNNPNSRKNLAQYNKRSKEAKEKALDNLKVVEKEEDFDPYSIFDEDSKSVITTFETLIHPREIFKNRSEQEIFWNTIQMFLKDFDIKELSFSDFDDIASLAKYTVLEHRLLLVASKSEKMVLEAMPSIDKIKKDNKEIKKNLAARRVDRIDTKNKPAFSIVELASHLDQQNKLDFEKRMLEIESAVKEYKPPKRDAQGNLIED